MAEERIQGKLAAIFVAAAEKMTQHTLGEADAQDAV